MPVDKPEYNLGFLHLLVGALYAYILNNIICIADASCIDEAELYAIDDSGILDEISCRTMYVAHNSLLLMQQMIEERALTHIGVANDSHGNAILKSIAHLKGTGKRKEALMDVIGKGVEFGTVGKLQLFMVGEVEFQFQ